MQEPQLFVLADRALDGVVQRIRDDQWSLPIPDWIPLAGRVDRSATTLRVLVNYHAYDDVWVPDVLAGRTAADLGGDPWQGVDLLGDDPAGRFAQIVEAAVAAAEALTEEDLRRTAHLSFGDFTVQEYFWQITQFRALRAVELGELVGAPQTLPVELVRGVRAQLEPHIESWRAIGVFGPEVHIPDGATEQDRLLGFVGRVPVSLRSAS